MIDTLLLNADFRPIRVVSWQRAVTLMLDGKVTLVADYPGRDVRSPGLSLPWPAVVVLRRYVHHNVRVKLSRANLLARDDYRCAYCGDRPELDSGRPHLEELTIDHVVPRARARDGKVPSAITGRWIAVTCWENLVTACMACNGQKADLTPAQAGLVLRVRPRRPQPWEMLRILFTRVHIPEEWKNFLPEDSAWRDYWTAELEP